MSERNDARAPKKLQEAAAFAALGLLSPGEAMAVPEREIAAMSEAAALLAEGVAPLAPAARVKSRLLAKVANFEQFRPLADVRRNEETWISSGVAGVYVKPLFNEPSTGRSTYLVRMDAGSRFPAHRHGDIEQCLVLEGDIGWGELLYERGDFIVMGKDSQHPEIYTVAGNLLLIVAGQNEI